MALHRQIMSKSYASMSILVHESKRKLHKCTFLGIYAQDAALLWGAALAVLHQLFWVLRTISGHAKTVCPARAQSVDAKLGGHGCIGRRAW